MNNPIAFADEYGAVIPASHKYFTPEIFKDYTIPLVELKELSDEEILDEYRQCYGDEGTLTDCYFARQILQRAQEK